MKRIIKVFVDASKLNDKCSIGIVMIGDKDRLLFKRHMKISDYKDTVKLEMHAIEKGVQIGSKRSRKNEMIIIYNDCMSAVKRSKLKYPDIQIDWIPRKNNYADLVSRKNITDEEFSKWACDERNRIRLLK